MLNYIVYFVAIGLLHQFNGVSAGRSSDEDSPAPTPAAVLPWFAGINVYNTYKCAGALISNTAVLTAAHCVDEVAKTPNLLAVRVGSPYLAAGGRILNVESVLLHPDYNWGFLGIGKSKNRHDLAILKLTTNVRRIPNVLPIQLTKRTDYQSGAVTQSRIQFNSQDGQRYSQQSVSLYSPVISRLRFLFYLAKVPLPVPVISATGKFQNGVVEFITADDRLVGVSLATVECDYRCGFTAISGYTKWLLTNKESL